MKKIKLIIAVLSFSLLTAMPSSAGQWKQENGRWWYENDDGSYPVNQWMEIGGKQYFFGADGYMLADTVTPDGFFVGADGAWIGGIADNGGFAITNSTLIRDDFSQYTGNQRKLKCYFDRVVFEGTDSGSIDWINAQVENVETQFINDYVSIIPEMLDKLQKDPWADFYDIGTHELGGVYYDGDYVSINWGVGWFSGGIDDSDCRGLNLNVADRSYLSLNDILGENAYEKIINELNRQGMFSVDASQEIKRSAMKDIEFYFDAEKVYVSIDTAIFGRTGGAIKVILPR